MLHRAVEQRQPRPTTYPRRRSWVDFKEEIMRMRLFRYWRWTAGLSGSALLAMATPSAFAQTELVGGQWRQCPPPQVLQCPAPIPVLPEKKAEPGTVEKKGGEPKADVIPPEQPTLPTEQSAAAGGETA